MSVSSIDFDMSTTIMMSTESTSCLHRVRYVSGRASATASAREREHAQHAPAGRRATRRSRACRRAATCENADRRGAPALQVKRDRRRRAPRRRRARARAATATRSSRAPRARSTIAYRHAAISAAREHQHEPRDHGTQRAAVRAAAAAAHAASCAGRRGRRSWSSTIERARVVEHARRVVARGAQAAVLDESQRSSHASTRARSSSGATLREPARQLGASSARASRRGSARRGSRGSRRPSRRSRACARRRASSTPLARSRAAARARARRSCRCSRGDDRADRSPTSGVRAAPAAAHAANARDRADATATAGARSHSQNQSRPIERRSAARAARISFGSSTSRRARR